MSDLFIERTAVLSTDKLYRYELRRVWDKDKPLLPVCMLNPSTADHEVDDPTILTLIHFGKLWGYGGLIVVNLFALRTSKPAELKKSHRPMGPENGDWVVAAIAYARANGGRALAAWGNGGDAHAERYEGGMSRADEFCRIALDHGVELICLGRTQSAAPKHPMARGVHRIPRDQQPIVWRVRA